MEGCSQLLLILVICQQFSNGDVGVGIPDIGNDVIFFDGVSRLYSVYRYISDVLLVS